MEIWLICYLILGAMTGVLAGLFGIGGGAVMVPVLAMLFAAQGFPSDYVVHLALGTSMAAIVPTSIASLRAHNRHNAVLWPAVRGLAPGILLGTFAATFIAAYLPPRPLAVFFCIIGDSAGLTDAQNGVLISALTSKRRTAGTDEHPQKHLYFILI